MTRWKRRRSGPGRQQRDLSLTINCRLARVYVACMYDEVVVCSKQRGLMDKLPAVVTSYQMVKERRQLEDVQQSSLDPTFPATGMAGVTGMPAAGAFVGTIATLHGQTVPRYALTHLIYTPLIEEVSERESCPAVSNTHAYLH